MKRGKWDKHIWEKKDIQYLKDNYRTMTNKELAAGLGIKLTTCRNKIYELGLQRFKLEHWNKSQIQFLLDNYREIGNVELAEILQENTPKKKGWTKNHIAKKMGYLKLSRTEEEIEAIKIRNAASSYSKMALTNRKRHQFEREDKRAKEMGYTCIAEAIIHLGKEQFKAILYGNSKVA